MNVSFRPHPSRLFFDTARNLIPAVDLCQRFSTKGTALVFVAVKGTSKVHLQVIAGIKQIKLSFESKTFFFSGSRVSDGLIKNIYCAKNTFDLFDACYYLYMYL